ncbi:uncharacterized protein LOC125491168 [Plutella xylostella]|uniref:uncharacterized protein LOC125491168 n=1 Tax=Plutella xylostella TaxID=51655 RepID=UPI0020330E19|nr:uncharacterized protein LOC125491168 [Plutella xylostella]
MTPQQIHNYFVTNFDEEPVDDSDKYNQEFFQNSSAFPNIPPVVNASKADIDHMLGQWDVEGLAAGMGRMAVDETSSSSSGPEETSAGSSEEADLFIKPLSNNGTVASTSQDGRVKLLVAVSPSSSSAQVGPSSPAPPAAAAAPAAPAGASLQVPRAAPITRSTSEKVPSRSDMMNALRAQWTRHTTK